MVQLQGHKTLHVLGYHLCDDFADVFQQAAGRSRDLCLRMKERVLCAVTWEYLRAARAGTTELDCYFKKSNSPTIRAGRPPLGSPCLRDDESLRVL